jgi:uncharacterized protein YfkK (UPF0435 family)
MKNAQSSMVFAYLFAAIVIALIFIFGYNQFSKTTILMKESELVLLKENMLSDVKDISSDFGSSKKVSYTIPENSELCILDLGKKLQILNSGILDQYPIIKDSVSSGISMNVFIIGKNDFEPMHLEDITLNEPYFHCFTPTFGKVQFFIEGLGNSTLIYPDSRI